MVGKRLKELRVERGMTLEEVGKAVGIGRPTVYKYEHDEIENVPPEKVHRLANLFGVTRPYLMGWTDERNVNPEKNLDMVAEKLSIPPVLKTNPNDVVLSGPDCVTAATQAMRTLIKFGVRQTPVYPQQVIQQSRIATMISFADVQETRNIMSGKELTGIRADGEYVLSSALRKPDGTKYLFAFNRTAPIGKLRYALAVELGHVYLGHVGFRKEDVRLREATCFAIHLLFPRPLIRTLQERGFRFTKETFARIFGDCEWSLEHIERAERIEVSPELNRLVREQFTPYAETLAEMGVFSMPDDGELLNLDRYMDGYSD